MRPFAPLCLFTLLFTSAASADTLDDAIALFRRQSVNLSTGGTTITTSQDASTTITTASTITTEGSVTTESSAITVGPSTTSSVSVILSTSTQTPSDAATTPTTADETSDSTTASMTLITSSATRQVITTFTTVSDGSTRVGTRTSNSVVPITTSVDPATLSGSGSGGGSSGLSSSTKATIGGVVGGIGGALLLGGLAYTAWRIWGKKKNLHDDDLYDPNNQEKHSSSTDNTPFRSTLDQYHQPGPVNTASNF